MKILNVLKKPALLASLAFIIGVIFGLVVLGWGLWPVEWVNADPSYLNQDYSTEYLRMVIDSYQLKQNEQLAFKRYQSMKSLGPIALQSLLAEPGDLDPAVIENIKGIMEASAALFPQTEETGEAAVSTTGKIAVIIIILGLVGVVGFFLFKYFLPFIRRTPSKGGDVRIEAKTNDQNEMTNYEALGEEPPIAQFMTTYVKGDDLFDDSFSIEAPSGEFLGECGIGISESIGVGDPKKVTAFEVWLFDKNDIQTVTKVLMSEHTYNDPVSYQRMEAKGEPFMVEPGKQIILETKALQLVAVVSEMKYAEDPLPEKSHFERLTLELAVWPRVVAPG